MKDKAIPGDVVELTENEFHAQLEPFLDLVAFAEDELVVTRNGQPIAAVISLEG